VILPAAADRRRLDQSGGPSAVAASVYRAGEADGGQGWRRGDPSADRIGGGWIRATARAKKAARKKIFKKGLTRV
jgi:hypothetical protein